MPSCTLKQRCCALQNYEEELWWCIQLFFKKKKKDLRVFWKPVNLQNCVWENHYQIIMKTILQEKETIHYNITIWYTNLFLILKQWKFLQQKQRWTRNGRNLKRFQRGTWQKSEVKRWSMKQGRRAQTKVHFASLRSYVIWKMLNWRQSTKKQRSSCTPKWNCKRRFRRLCSIHRTRIISISNDSSKSHGYHFQIARLRWTSSWRSICASSRTEDCTSEWLAIAAAAATARQLGEFCFGHQETGAESAKRAERGSG